MLPHSPFSPELILSDLYPSGPLKNIIYGEKFGDDKATVEMKMWLRQTSENFY
jgi:hypothetical protein